MQKFLFGQFHTILICLFPNDAAEVGYREREQTHFVLQWFPHYFLCLLYTSVQNSNPQSV